MPPSTSTRYPSAHPAESSGAPEIPTLKRLEFWIRSFYEPQIVAGLRAEFHFDVLARQRRWALERVAQSRESMAKYRGVTSDRVKRGDFICRNCQNVEIELKCKTLYRDGAEPFYYVDYSEIKGLRAMQEITATPVVLAFMERDGSDVRRGSLRMAKLDFVLDTHDYRRGLLYNARNRCVRVPVKYTRPGFEVLRMMGGTGDA